MFSLCANLSLTFVPRGALALFAHVKAHLRSGLSKKMASVKSWEPVMPRRKTSVHLLEWWAPRERKEKDTWRLFFVLSYFPSMFLPFHLENQHFFPRPQSLFLWPVFVQANPKKRPWLTYQITSTLKPQRDTFLQLSSTLAFSLFLTAWLIPPVKVPHRSIFFCLSTGQCRTIAWCGICSSFSAEWKHPLSTVVIINRNGL